MTRKHAQQAIILLAGVLIGVLGSVAVQYLGLLQRFVPRVSYNGPEGMSASRVGTAGPFEVVAVTGGSLDPSAKTHFVYSSGKKLLSLTTDSNAAVTRSVAYMDNVTVMYHQRPGSAGPCCQVSYRLPSGLLHYLDRDLDGVFDDRWREDPVVGGQVNLAEVWFDGRWVVADDRYTSTRRMAQSGDGPFPVVFQQGQWIRDTERESGTSTKAE